MLKITIITKKDTGSTLLKSYYIISNLLGIDRIMNEKMSKRRIQIIDFQKQEIEEKEETTLLIRLHIFYKILTINLCFKK